MQLVHQCTARRYGFPSVGGPRAGGLNVEDLTWRFSDSAAEGETLLQTLFSLLRFFFFYSNYPNQKLPFIVFERSTKCLKKFLANLCECITA